MSSVVRPPVHRKVNGAAPATVRLTEPFALPQLALVTLLVTVGGNVDVTVAESNAEQPMASVTVTKYKPVSRVETLGVLPPLLHAKV